jgi:hypothetical protein
MNHPRALVIAGLSLVLAACAAETADTTTTSAEMTTTTAAPEPTTTTAPATTTTTVATTEHQLDFVIPVTLTTPSDWTAQVTAQSHVIDIVAPNGLAIFASRDTEVTTDGWLAELAAEENLVVGEPTPVEVGGAPGITFEVAFGAATEGLLCGDALCVLILNRPDYQWAILDGYPNQIWILDVNGSTVLIAAEPSSSSSTFLEEFEEVLASVEWGES